MSEILRAIARHARERPHAVALVGENATTTYAELHAAVQHLAGEWVRRSLRTAALAADNGIAWALADLAAIASGTRLVPLPLFFSPQQLRHALHTSGADALLFESQLPDAPIGRHPAETLAVHRWPAAVAPLRLMRLESSGVPLPCGTAKITYTSGTTGEPKGVCLRVAEQERVAASLVWASGADAGFRHVSTLPLSTLLENIGGLYAPLLAGATSVLLPLARIGLDGASGIDAARLLYALYHWRASTCILVPQMALALVTRLEAAPLPLPHLRFIAVGGAPAAPSLIERARRAGLPLYEGYGLSECASVVALNAPGADRVGSVGRVLPHLQLRLNDDGEIQVKGSRLLGYAGEGPAEDEYVATGDLGHVDADGFLYITGRKKNLFVTAYGRNVAPEWVERELCVQPAIAQAAVFGEARPFNCAVIVARSNHPAAIQAAVDAANAALPDYARISRWIAADAAFTLANGQATANGRLRRAALWTAYAERIEALYEA